MNLPNMKRILFRAIFAVLACVMLVTAISCTSEVQDVKTSKKGGSEVQVSVEQQNPDKSSSEMVEVIAEDNINQRSSLLVYGNAPTLDRTKPLYKVYKNGCYVSVPTELQWYIRDLCTKYKFTEKYVYGMILLESCFNAKAQNGSCLGLCQINKFWINGAAITHFTTNYKSRNLKDPYDNLLTMAEMWCYAKSTYNLDLTTENGMMKVCYWHNTGRDPRRITKSSYFNTVAKFAKELVALQ